MAYLGAICLLAQFLLISTSGVIKAWRKGDRGSWFDRRTLKPHHNTDGGTGTKKCFDGRRRGVCRLTRERAATTRIQGESFESVFTYPIHLYQESTKNAIECLFRGRMIAPPGCDPLHL